MGDFDDTSTVCMVLDPRLKLDLIKKQTKKNAAKQLLKKLFNDYSSSTNSSTSPVEYTQINTQTLSYSNTSKKSIGMLERLFNGGSVINNVTSVREVDQYLLEPSTTFNKSYNVLNYWKIHQEKYPVLSKIAKNYLAIQPTSVPSERSFSQEGLTVTKTRNRLTPETVKKLMCLKSWYKD